MLKYKSLQGNNTNASSIPQNYNQQPQQQSTLGLIESLKPYFAEPNTNLRESANVLGRELYHGVKGTLDLPFNAYNLLGLLGAPHATTPSEYIQNKFGYTEKQFEGKSALERLLHRLTEWGPAAAVSGPAALARTGLGSLVATAAGEIGAPEALQDVLHMGTELAAGRVNPKTLERAPEIVKKIFSGIPTGESALRTAQKELESIKTPPTEFARPVHEAISDIKSELLKEPNQNVKSVMEDIITTITDNFKSRSKNLKTMSGKSKIVPKHLKKLLDFQDARKLRENIYSMSENLIKNREIDIRQSEKYITPLTKSINKFIFDFESKYPKFTTALNTRDRLTEMKYMGSYISDFAEKLGPNKLTKVLTMVPRAILYPLGEGEKVLYNMAVNPIARQHYAKVAIAAMNNNPDAFVKALSYFTPAHITKPTNNFNSQLKYKSLVNNKTQS
jgi:hypothetical protein